MAYVLLRLWDMLLVTVLMLMLVRAPDWGVCGTCVVGVILAGVLVVGHHHSPSHD